MIDAERIAKRFHEICEELASAHGFEVNERIGVPWEQAPREYRLLMIHVVNTLAREGTIKP